MPPGTGCTQGYKRDWPAYNDQLVRRGELLIDLDWLAGWEVELDEMNEGKEGRPYAYPDSLMDFVAALRQAFRLPWRQGEGLLRSLFQVLGPLHPHLAAPDYTVLWRRAASRVLELSVDLEGDLVIAVDSSGIKVTNRGEWIRRFHPQGPARGFLKPHLAVDTASKVVLATEVTDERTGDGGLLPDLVEAAREAVPRARIRRVLADGAYDTKDNFAFLEEGGIEAGIWMRYGGQKAKGLSDRAFAARELRRLGEDGWKAATRYGQRWACEQAFSAVKRIFGEHVMARRQDLMVAEVLTKVALYNRMLRA